MDFILLAHSSLVFKFLLLVLEVFFELSLLEEGPLGIAEHLVDPGVDACDRRRLYMRPLEEPPGTRRSLLVHLYYVIVPQRRLQSLVRTPPRHVLKG